MKKPPRGMRMRWLGMALVALAVVIGTPVAVSFVPGVLMDCPAQASFPAGRTGTDTRGLAAGALVQDRLVYPSGVMSLLGSVSGDISPFAFRWSTSADHADICVPVWPIPLIIGVLGVKFWRRGGQRLREQRAKPFSGWRSAHRWCRRLAPSIVVAGIALCAMVAMSFACLGGVNSRLEYLSGDDIVVRDARAVRGVVLLERSPLWMASRYAGFPGPLDMWWRNQGGNKSICIPFWPLPILLLSVGGVMLWRNERALLLACRGGCPKCGYPIHTVPSGVCPECGQ